jgi:large subunit ribosomal protein L23
MKMNPYKIIIRPVNTEKSHIGVDKGHYTFIVSRRANKVEVAMAVQEIFGVNVVKVRMLNQAPKFGRWGRKRVQRQSTYKKAMVTLPPGQKIEIFEGV